MKVDNSQYWSRVEDLDGQRYPLPQEWDPLPEGTAMFTLHFGELVCIPVAQVCEINGVRVPQGERREFPLGLYALANLDGRVEWVGPWPERLRAHASVEIAEALSNAQAPEDDEHAEPLRTARVLH